MPISYAQTRSLLQRIANSAPDSLDCDGCFELLAEFAELELRGEPISVAMRAVQTHLEQCPCCAYEYASLIEAVRAADTMDSKEFKESE